MVENLIPIAPRKKKVVHYHQLRDCKVGRRASVWPVDHPDVPVGKSARTTVVQTFDPLTGVVETANTRYEPGLFGEWSELGDSSPNELVNDFKTIVPSMPLPFYDNLDQIA
jgi:hypothetical protein